MQMSIALFLLGILLLLVSTQQLIKFAERLSGVVHLSPLIIGLTLVSIGTSLPELVVSGLAILRGDAGLATGNIIGSNIVNVLLVLGIGILSGNLKVGTTKTQKNIFIMLGTTVLFLLLYFFKIPGYIAGSILLIISLFIIREEYLLGVNGRTHEDAKSYVRRQNRVSFSQLGAMIASSLVGVVAGGWLTVSAVEQLSVLLGYSTTILGLSITAIATSLPELLTTIFSQRDHQNKIVIGNLIGSNIFNLTLIGGMLLLFSPWNIISKYEITMLSITTLIFVSIIIKNNGKVIPRKLGLLLLGLFLGYLYFLR